VASNIIKEVDAGDEAIELKKGLCQLSVFDYICCQLSFDGASSGRSKFFIIFIIMTSIMS